MFHVIKDLHKGLSDKTQGSLIQRYLDILDLAETEATRDDRDFDPAARHVVYHEPKTDALGGARLFSPLIENKDQLRDRENHQRTQAPLYLPPHMARLTSPSLSHQEDYTEIQGSWLLDRVFFYLPDACETHDNPPEFSTICHRFYQDLYTFISEFPPIKEAESFMLWNEVDEHKDIQYFGQWPLLTESFLSLSEDGVWAPFHGESHQHPFEADTLPETTSLYVLAQVCKKERPFNAGTNI